MSGDSPKYLYQNLKRKPPNFRLLTIQPGAELTPIKATITTHRLNTPPAYEALSYVWGPPSLDTPPPISINDHLFSVTPNLLKALYGLRSEKHARVVWIDAICINQEDLEERSWQIPLMKQIYSNATQTIVFLGEASLRSSRTIAFMKSMNIKRAWKNEEERVEIENANKSLRKRLATEEGLQELMMKGVFGDLLKRAFWNRIWIVQEVVLAKSVSIICGPDEISWADFSDATINLQEAFSADPENVGTNYAVGGLANLINIDHFREIRKYGYSLLLGDVVACLRQSNSTDPRDMIYGVMGLITTSIRPDYTRATPENVYMSLVEESLVQHKSLDIICMRNNQGSVFNLPSWVPDWTDPWMLQSGQQGDSIEGSNLPPNPLIMKYFDGALLSQSVVGCQGSIHDGESVEVEPWNAHGRARPVASVSGSTRTLTAQGVQIGVVETIAKALTEDDNSIPFFWEALDDWEVVMLQVFGNCRSLDGKHNLTDVFDRWLYIYSWLSTKSMKEEEDERVQEKVKRQSTYAEGQQTYHSGGDLVEAFIRTICADRDEYYRRITDETYHSFWESGKDGVPKFDMTLCHMVFATNRRLMITGNGYIGLVPIRARKGDHICVLFGCSVPVILREEKGSVTFVGEAYVHGFMDGEAIAEMKRGGLNKREWDIT